VAETIDEPPPFIAEMDDDPTDVQDILSLSTGRLEGTIYEACLRSKCPFTIGRRQS
jgi:hypothetical protein